MSDNLTMNDQTEQGHQAANATTPAPDVAPGNDRGHRTRRAAVMHWWRRPWVRAARWFVAGIASVLGFYAGYIEIKNYNETEKQRIFYQKVEKAKFRVLVPLQANNKEYLDFIQLEPGAYYDAGDTERFSSKVAQNIRSSVKAAKETWFAQANHSDARKLPADKVDFYFFPEGTDKVSFERAFEKALVEARLAGRDIIALIGNASSSATKVYGEFCGKETWEVSEENKKLLNGRLETKTEDDIKGKLSVEIPMILPLATATSLTHNLRVFGVPATLRLLPANDRQAEFVATVLLNAVEPRAIKAVIVKDLSNKVYSEDLLEGFREHYVQYPLSQFEKNRAEHPNIPFPEDFGRILSVMSVGGEFGELTVPFMYPGLNELSPDALVIFGMTNTSLETLAQAKASKLNFKYIILTDGAVDEHLLPRLASLVSPTQLKNLYLTFPLRCAMPAELDTILSKEVGTRVKRDFELTHAMYVVDSAFVILSLLEEEAKANWTTAPKKFIVDAITEWKNNAKSSGKSVNAMFPLGGREYVIDQFGNNKNLDYHLYRIEVNNGTKRRDSSIRWKHAEICPSAIHKNVQPEQSPRCMEEQTASTQQSNTSAPLRH